MDTSGNPDKVAAREADDPFAQAAGHIGAAPAPSWGQKAEPSRPHKTAVTRGKALPAAGSVYSEAAYGTRSRSRGRSWAGRRYRAPRYQRWSRAPASPRSQRITMLVLGVPTVGLVWLAGTVTSWVGYFRARGNNWDRAVARSSFRWAVAFSVLTALAAAVWVAAATGASNDNSSSDLPSPVSLTRSLGQSATLTEPVAAKGDGEVPVTVTFGNWTYPTSLPNQVTSGHPAPDTATGLLTVCATSKAVDPMGVVFSLGARAGGNLVSADFDTAYETTPFQKALRPRHCASSVVGFPVPAGQSVQAVQFGVDGGVAWTVPFAPVTGGPTTT